MPTLTETIIDLANYHTTLYYLTDTPLHNSPLSLNTPTGYSSLYQTITATMNGAKYGDIRQNATNIVLDHLKPAYHDDKYWRRYLGTSIDGWNTDAAWKDVVPIETTLKPRIEVVLDSRFKFTVKPVPRVLLYPFGWSTWISLLLVGEHTLGDLAEFLPYLFTEKVFQTYTDPTTPTGGQTRLSLHHLFDLVAHGIRTDAFGGKETKDFDPQDTIVVTTVLAKHGGSLSLGALSAAEKLHLQRIIKPEGPSANKALEEYIYKLDPGSLNKYVAFERHGRFIWLEDLLWPTGFNHQHLRCYHNNTFHSLLHAVHLYSLLVETGKQKSPTSTLRDLASTTINQLQSPNYRNASLIKFLERSAVKMSIEKVEKLMGSVLNSASTP